MNLRACGKEIVFKTKLEQTYTHSELNKTKRIEIRRLLKVPSNVSGEATIYIMPRMPGMIAHRWHSEPFMNIATPDIIFIKIMVYLRSHAIVRS